MIVVIDYKMGNLRSILHKLGQIGVEAIVSSKAKDIENAKKLILPGVGAFDTGMNNLKTYNLIEILNKKVLEERIPILGICVGMQLYAKQSEEGNAKGLGWIDAEVKRFNFAENNNRLRVPLVGWNTINQKRESPILKGVVPSQRFYFTHSYHVCCNSPGDVVATTHYGYDFVSVLQHKNIFGLQFHTEKSHRRGIELVKNFVEYS
ncbi:imidazole glycerol phosphate synthase subunit HisH [Chloroflexota bacterium]